MGSPSLQGSSAASAPQVWDVIVVGAGPAGCAAAYDLAAMGRQVLLVDRAMFPRPKACAGGLTMKAVRALRYPIDPVVRRWVRSIVLEEAQGSGKGLDGGQRSITVGRRSPVCAMTMREELDSFCLARTRQRGAGFRQIPALAAIEQKQDRVVLRLADGERLEARFLLGADGVHSRVRALATDAGWFRRGFAIEANVPYVAANEQYPLTFDFAPVPRGYGWLFPRDNHVNVGLYVESFKLNTEAEVHDEADGARRERNWIDRAALDRYIASRCGAGRDYGKPTGQFLGLGAAGYSPAAETRVLLAGDAAGFVDPLTGEGIHGAIRSGQAAAAAMHAALGGACKSGSRRDKALARGTPLALGFHQAAATLQADLQVAEHAASRFFANPARGFQLMRMPVVPQAVLRAYSEGLSLGVLLRGVCFAGRFTLR